jgi:hypothetical protein
VAGIGNVMRHEYEDVAHDVLWHVVHNDLPTLEKACRDELATGLPYFLTRPGRRISRIISTTNDEGTLICRIDQRALISIIR